MQTDFKKTKKKVGILTFHFVYNVGAVLQAYALKKFLNNFCDCSIVNYCPQYHLDLYVLKKENMPLWKARQLKKSLPKGISSFLKSIKCYFLARKNYEYRMKKNQTKKYKRIIKDLSSSQIILDKENLVKEVEKYQALIVGSDQLWNKIITNGFDEAYFLDIKGYDKEKYSYAVSAGNCFEKEDLAFVKEKLKNFNGISVREKSLCDQLNENGVPAFLSVDPTFLLDKNDYIKLEKKVNVKKPFIFVYCFSVTEQLNSLLKELQDKHGYEIVFSITYVGQITEKLTVKCKKLYGISAEEFLYCMRNSEMVVTSTFHGTVFSIIYQKKFIVIPTPFGSSRLTNLLTELNLQNHIIGSENFSVDSDWGKVSEFIENRKKESIEYLKNISYEN